MTFQEKFLLLMERVSEPLYQSPRGSANVYFNVPMDNLCEKKKKAAMSLRGDMPTDGSVIVHKPKQMPDLTHFGSICPRKGQFLYFVPSHRKLGEELKNILMAEKSMDDLYNLACACRDSPMINPELFIYAMSSCIVSRKDMRQIRLPPFYEMMPDHFVSAAAIHSALEIGRMPVEDRTVLELNSNTTGKNNNPENKLWYFREDIGANSHHFHWHVVYGGMTPKYPAPGSRHRRGELFYYMHHGMIARYDAERLSNGLPRVKPISLENPVIPEGYFGKLYLTNSGENWGNRQENTVLKDVFRSDISVTMEDLKIWRDRILEAIDTGVVLAKDDKNQDIRMKLTSRDGIDLLGDMIENSETLSPNLQFYGPGLHNFGHVIIAFSHDPRHKFREFSGPMGDTSTALRDPVFYRWHKYIDNIFEKYKTTLQPYNDINGELPLKWNNIEVKSSSVVNSRNPEVSNTLTTFWMMSDIDLARGIDFGRTSTKMLGSVWGRFTHLQYDVFDYKIEVENRNSKAVLGTVRIFMAPRLDENGDRFSMVDQQKLFFELDKFAITLKPGMNSLSRSSKDSSVTIPWENSFAQLENRMNKFKHEMANYPAEEGICGCGWPQHLLLPRGTPEGMLFDVVVFVTNGEEDKPQKGQGMSTGSDKEKCRQAMSFCGILDEMYPDSKPMGYPFDRAPFSVVENNSMTQVPVPNLDKYAEKIPNMTTFVAKIVHNPHRKEMRPQVEGQPITSQMEMMDINGKCGASKRNPSSHPPNNNNPRSPPPRDHNQRPPQSGSGRNPYGSQGGGGRQIYFPTNGNRKGRDYGNDDGYEIVDSEDGYSYDH